MTEGERYNLPLQTDLQLLLQTWEAKRRTRWAAVKQLA